MKKIKIFKKIFYIIILIIISNSIINSASDPKSLTILESLDFKNSIVKSLRKDVRKAIIVIKGNKQSCRLPDLKFYKYKVKKNEDFWSILCKTSLNMDTISTINLLSSPADVYPGKEIFLSNMRGIIHKVKRDDTIGMISRKYNIDEEYINKVNNINEHSRIEKEYIFVPSGGISNIERSLFLGSGFACPLTRERRTSSFGRRIDPFNKKFAFHRGIDLACAPGSSVYAARKGTVYFAGYSDGYGLLVIIDHENNYSTYYGHLKKILKKKGSIVKRGELIALSGNSGRSTGPHLHFEVRKNNKAINPGRLLK